MKISVAVHGGPQSSQSARTAARFTEAALNAGHEIYRVFFYHEGVRTGDTNSVVPQDESSSLNDWLRLKSQHNLDLSVCIAAAIRRGVLNTAERERYDRTAANIHPDFEIVGLGQLIDAMIESDRFVTFAA